MDATTYSDPGVVDALQRNYVAVQADHDARPDLAERYRDFGWPATIILRPDGTELIKKAGYIASTDMHALLKRTAVERDAVRDAPRRSMVEAGTSPELPHGLRAELERRHLATVDPKRGGLALMQKFLDADTVEWDLHLAGRGDAQAERRARYHLDAAQRLIDPAFGGAYQYSTHGDWAHPHYEKIMRTQLAYLRTYSLAYTQLGDPRYRTAAERIAVWLSDFMQADSGAFYTSQDADVRQGRKAHDYFSLDREQRLARGLPRIDRNQYADMNGMVIEGLASLYAASGDKRHLALAVPALDWALRHRRTEDGGYRHTDADSAGPYLADNLHMGRALLAIYEVSGQQAWLAQAKAVAGFIDAHFRREGGGLVSAVDNGTPVTSVAQLDQNLQAARFLYALAAQSDDPDHLALADHVMRYLTIPSVATSRLTDAGILLAARDRSKIFDGKHSLRLLFNAKNGDAS